MSVFLWSVPIIYQLLEKHSMAGPGVKIAMNLLERKLMRLPFPSGYVDGIIVYDCFSLVSGIPVIIHGPED